VTARSSSDLESAPQIAAPPPNGTQHARGNRPNKCEWKGGLGERTERLRINQKA